MKNDQVKIIIMTTMTTYFRHNKRGRKRHCQRSYNNIENEEERLRDQIYNEPTTTTTTKSTTSINKLLYFKKIKGKPTNNNEVRLNINDKDNYENSLTKQAGQRRRCSKSFYYYRLLRTKSTERPITN